MKVLFVSSEAAPFAKVGGIADVVGALPRALQGLGIDVRVVIPRYSTITPGGGAHVLLRDVAVRANGAAELCTVYETALPDSTIPVYLVENIKYLSRGPIYNEHGDEDPFTELSRFMFFDLSIAAMIPLLGWTPDIVHCHDWHTGLVPALLKIAGRNDINSVFTIHNIAHQGVWKAEDVFTFIGAAPTAVPEFKARDPRGDFNLLQQGILGASYVNTVSPEYAREILTPEYGERLETVLKSRKGHLSGILNGIDTTRFNPATDTHLRVRYDTETIKMKLENKLALHEQCGFGADAAVPTYGFVGRLAEQKGVDLIAAITPLFAEENARLIILGTGIPQIEQQLAALAARYPDHLSVKIAFDDIFAQHIYAGADMLLVPSKFEPCGLVQMIAMRYGTPTIVRATGGLKDSVPDVDADPAHGLGFAFSAYTPKALTDAVRRSLASYRDPKRWQRLVHRCMAHDFSWDRSAHSYLALYERARK